MQSPVSFVVNLATSRHKNMMGHHTNISWVITQIYDGAKDQALGIIFGAWKAHANLNNIDKSEGYITVQHDMIAPIYSLCLERKYRYMEEDKPQ